MSVRWRIGDLEVDGRVVLGPMSGYTSSSYRDFMKPFGVAASVTEMVSDKGVIHDQKKTIEYLLFPENRPTGLQLFGSDPDELAEAAETALVINPDIAFIDVNMGCPVDKIVKKGSGSYLMRNPAKCGVIIRRIKSKVDVPVTAKIRLGWSPSEKNYRIVMETLEAAGADCIMLHVRTRSERYAGNPDYAEVRGLRDEMSVPLVISGNIYCLEDAQRAVSETGAEGVMLARGGVGNPFLVTQIDEYFRTGRTLPNPTISQQVDWCLEFSRMLIEEKGMEAAVRKMRSYAPRFISGCTNGRLSRNRLATETRDYDSMCAILEDIREAYGHQTVVSSQGICGMEPDGGF